DPRVEHEQDPAQHLAVGQTRPAGIAKAPLLLRQQRLDQLPQLIRDDPRRGRHRHPPSLTTGADSFAAALAVPSQLKDINLVVSVTPPRSLPTPTAALPGQRHLIPKGVLRGLLRGSRSFEVVAQSRAKPPGEVL